MSIKLTKRTASLIMHRGMSSVRIKPTAIEDATKAITREDVRALIKNGSIYAIKEKHNASRYGKELRIKRNAGRKRGKGKRKGTTKARTATGYVKKVRAQRRILEKLKSEKSITNEMYKELYALVKGGTFQTKASLLNHIRSKGLSIDDTTYNKLKHS